MRQRSFLRICSAAVVLLVGATTTRLWADGNVGIGTTTPDTSALLELRSQRQGLLIPRLTTTQRNTIVLPAKSLLIFNSTTNRFEYNEGTPTEPNWVPFATGSGSFWSLQGNTGIDPTMNFLGTTDAQPLILKTNGQERLRITPSGNVGIGTNNPLSLLSVGNASQFQVNAGGQITAAGLNLQGPSALLQLSGNAGQPGDLLVSNGPASQPQWTKTLDSLHVRRLILQQLATDTLYARAGRIDTLYTRIGRADTIYSRDGRIDTLWSQIARIDSLIGRFGRFDTLYVRDGRIDTLYTQVGRADTIYSRDGRIDTLWSQIARIDSLIGRFGRFDTLYVRDGRIDTLYTQVGRADTIYSRDGRIDTLWSQIARIDSLIGRFGRFDTLYVRDGRIDTLYTQVGRADTIYSRDGRIDTLWSQIARIDSLIGRFGRFDTLYVRDGRIDTLSVSILRTDSLIITKPINISVPFDSIKTGVNTNQTLTVGSGSVLLPGGTGIVQANQFVGLGSLTTAVDLGTQEVAGVLPINKGGTGISTIGSAGSIAYSNGITLAFTSTGSPGQVLISNGSAAPSWQTITAASLGAWTILGNSGTNPDAPQFNFLGTTDNRALAIRTNNTERMRIKADGKIALGIGTSSTASNAFGTVQISDNTTQANYSALAVYSIGSVPGSDAASTVTMAFSASKQATSYLNVGGYLVAAGGTNNYALVSGAGGNVYLGHVDSLTPTPLRNTLLPNGNPNRTYVHHLNISGELVASLQGGGFGAGSPGQVLISQGLSAAPQWASPTSVFGGTTWLLGGNTLGTEQAFGSKDNVALPLMTNNQERLRITADGRIGIGTNAPQSSAAVEISSTTRGFLPPRMTATERDAIASPAEGLIVYVTTTSQEGYWYYDGTRWLPLISTVSANSTIVTRYKTSDESVSNSNALQDDDHLFATLGAGEVWEVEGMLDFSSSSTTPDVAFGLSVPSGATFKLSYHSNDGSPTGFRAGVLSSGSASVEIPAGGSAVVFVRGIVIMGSGSGTVRLQWAQNTADATPTTARTSSYLKFTRIQ
ncbi:MAG: hypothetical protein KatS3mg039_1009 [Candidatus Kapaibacterium sp.]|nr:MAG: hypothetical protein KatS3mg039_1009 [Candidatus Kapabacteria bacterium]